MMYHTDRLQYYWCCCRPVDKTLSAKNLLFSGLACRISFVQCIVFVDLVTVAASAVSAIEPCTGPKIN